MQITIPPCILEQLEELAVLCEKYPRKIPIEKCAKFIGIDRRTLSDIIDERNYTFGLCKGHKTDKRTFFIPTATFYFWFTQTHVFFANKGIR